MKSAESANPLRISTQILFCSHTRYYFVCYTCCEIFTKSSYVRCDKCGDV